jgi:type I restriction enzyme, R subunit
MPVDHREVAFEDAIEHHLLAHGGYARGSREDFDRVRALDAAQLFAFLESTQPDLLAHLRQHHGASLRTAVLEGVAKTLETRGTLDVLRNGAKFPASLGKTLRLAYFQPAHGRNPETRTLYEQNRLTVTRQLRYSHAHDNELDLVLALNGIPIVTAELKNPFTGQTVEHAKRQYQETRDPADAIFRFKTRALVHFAVDPDEAYMTTRLAGKATHFLPFNRGRGTGAGNPENPGGYRTAYLWEKVWERDSLLDILARFLHLQVEEKDTPGGKLRKETLIFPRYHQLDAVRRLVMKARDEGPGHNYLVQHSAGSGKSNSIAWLAHRLASLHGEDDAKVFDSVVVVTDRRVLDRQLQDTIYQFEHADGVVEGIRESARAAHLADALNRNVPIIVTTLQTFPFVSQHLATLPKKRYAVILDEAHSSQTGEGAIEMKGVLAGAALDEAVQAEAEGLKDYEEEILRTMLARGSQPNLSFFAFTATPKAKTLEFFGRKGADGKPEPFHLYSMRQAIDEGFILDVLRSYTTYKTYFRLLQATDDDPEVDKRKAARALARFISFHPHHMGQKAEVIVEHFRTHTRHKIGGKAKAMVVTASRLHAVLYKQEIDHYVREKKYDDVHTLVAFSGTVTDELGHEFTETSMNGGIGDQRIPEEFATDAYQLLVVAEKFQTGFDQPLLHTMYVDKRLDGIQAVQTLSRLNRTHAGKEDTFILDFANDPEEVVAAFQPYYEQTSVAATADPQQLYDLQHRLDESRIYTETEVLNFARVFFKPKVSQTPADHAQLNGYVDPAVDRFRALDEDRQEELRAQMAAFRNLYAFLSQVIPYTDSDLEKLYAFTRFLLSKLPRMESGGQYELDDDVTLQYYRLQKVSERQLELKEGEAAYVPGPSAVGTGMVREKLVPLSSLIQVLNERFGTDFRPADELFLVQIREDAAANQQLVQAANANPIENFKFVFDREIEGLFIDRMDQNEDMFARFMNNTEFKQVITRLLMTQVYDQIRAAAALAE